MWELGLGHVCAEHPERQEGADGLHTSGVVSSCIFYFFVGTKWSGGCDGFGGATGGKREESRGNLSGINGVCSKK